MLLLVVWAFYTDRIVTWKTHQRALEERDEFKQEWADALKLAGRATTVADKALQDADYGGNRLQAQRQVRSGRRGDDDDHR